MKIELNYYEGKIYAESIKSNGKIGSLYSDVTDRVVQLALQHIVDMRTTSDNQEIFEYVEPVRKWGGKKYKVCITITPME